MYRHFTDFDEHVLVTHRHDARSGLDAFIVVHNENRGTAMGGCRMLKYASHGLAIKDVLRLSRGMTYKNAIANIPYGGGKAVIIADPRTEKSTALLHAMGDFVQSLNGRYITSFDSGTSIDDVHTIGERTDFTAGTLSDAGNASDSTASGVYYCMRAAAERVHGTPELGGMTVAIQGVGNVGRRLAERLAADGVNLIIADVDPASAHAVAQATGANAVGVDEILRADADILSPCALGGILSAQTIPNLKAKIVVGGANNQLASASDGERLHAAGIVYCPDYLANAGGMIDLHYQRSIWTRGAVDEHVRQLAETFHEIMSRSRSMGLAIAKITAAMAEERLIADKGRQS